MFEIVSGNWYGSELSETLYFNATKTAVQDIRTGHAQPAMPP